MKKKAETAKRIFFSWIVIRFKQDLSFSTNKPTASHPIIIKKLPIPWKLVCRLFPGISIGRLFNSLNSSKIDRLIDRAIRIDPRFATPDFFSYCMIGCPLKTDRIALLRHLLGYESVEIAYIQNASASPPFEYLDRKSTVSNGFLSSAPIGIDAGYAWKQKAGDGEGLVRFIDIEQGWLTGHQSVPVNRLPATGIDHAAFKEHGIAVLGIIAGRRNDSGPPGIVPRANGYVISLWRPDGRFNFADAIMAAIPHLSFGDILLLEMQSVDSTRNGKVWPVEIQDAVFDAIRLCTALGIIVIEPAGNGNFSMSMGSDLDLFNHDGKDILHPGSQHFKDSGAILVAAASSAVPHERLPYSNYGKRVNCYAWGEHIHTAGNFPRRSGYSNALYTADFGGTSGASAIVAGVAMAVQSIAEAKGQPRLGPGPMRDILSNEFYNTASRNGHIRDKIGVMPDLKKIIEYAIC